MTSGRPGRKRGLDRGQAAVEFALALPVVIVLVLGIVQVVIVGSRQLTVEHLSRSGARAASVAADPAGAARAEVDRASPLRPVAVETRATADLVTVTVRFVDGTTVPVVGHAIGPVELSATTTMRREPP